MATSVSCSDDIIPLRTKFPQKWSPIPVWEHSSRSVSVPVQWTSPSTIYLLPGPNTFVATTNAPMHTCMQSAIIYHFSRKCISICVATKQWSITKFSILCMHWHVLILVADGFCLEKKPSLKKEKARFQPPIAWSIVLWANQHCSAGIAASV